MEMTAGEIAKFLDGKLEGDPDLVIKKLATLQGADANSIAFYADTTHENQLYESKASAVLLPLDFKLKKKMEATLIRVENPYLFFSKLMALFEKASQKTKTGIETPAFIGEQCQLGEEVYIGAFSYIGDHSILGENVSVYPGCWIGEHVKIGPHSTIYAGVKIYPNTEIGSHCILHAGAVIGSDGFGFLPMENKAGYQKIPQLGKVILEDHVEIGANTVIDRATLDATVVEKGTKLDNLVQIGHNVRIGKHTVIAAQTGVAGSARIGDFCQIGGQTGIAGHIKVADGTKIQGQAGITKSTKPDSQLYGTPAIDYRAFLKSYAIFKKLPEIIDRNKR